jgi:preprotein translocase subunit SecD
MNRNTNWLIVIIILFIGSLWIDLSNKISFPNPFNGQTLFSRNTQVRLGLDLRGGLQTLLEADVPATTTVNSSDLSVTRQILENRANALGVSEVVMQTAGERRIVAEFPGVSNPEEVVASLQQTALLEFVDFGSNPVAVGTKIETDHGSTPTSTTGTTPAATEATTAPAATATAEATQAAPTAEPTEAATVYHTVMTGADLKEAHVATDSLGQPAVGFSLSDNGKTIFADYTTTHVKQYLGIVLDKTVISAPVVNTPITDGAGIIQGKFTADEANKLAIQLSYGALPVPVKVVESRTVGATLGEESVRKSLLAGMIGLGVVILFMALYYRLPGVLADLALVIFALLSLAIFKLGISLPAILMVGLFLILAVTSNTWWGLLAIVSYVVLLAANTLSPVTLTLPGIAGFILSIGMAVDANILIFERMKEELRAGRNLRQAIDLGWSRAWPSIRDSNTSSLITCLILYVFGSSFGASMVKGFSITLALGILVSLFTAIIVTRTFLHTVLDNIKLADQPRWFGL